MGKTSKDKRDIYYRLAKEQGYRARSAFKLLQIDDEYTIFKGVSRVVDLCAAPGSWSQVLSQKICSDDAKIVAVDLQPMAPIDRVIQLQGDITLKSTADALMAALGDKPADLVVCDGAPDVTGLHEMDEYMQSQLLFAALHITAHVLKPNGVFVAKMFKGVSTTLVYCQLRMLFEDVQFFKPASSRASSFECFVIGRGFCGMKGDDCRIRAESLTAFIESGYCKDALKSFGREAEEIVPFLASGDLSGLWDSETTYPVPEDHAPLPPVQPPTAPPYKSSVHSSK